MRRLLLLVYQLITGFLETLTGLLLIFRPGWALHLMRLPWAPGNLLFVSYTGVVGLSVGLAGLYGAYLVTSVFAEEKLAVVWVLTTISRALVAVFVAVHISAGSMGAGWITVAITDGLLALIQVCGLARGWYADAAR